MVFSSWVNTSSNKAYCWRSAAAVGGPLEQRVRLLVAAERRAFRHGSRCGASGSLIRAPGRERDNAARLTSWSQAGSRPQPEHSAMMQKPVAANHTMALPTKLVNSSHHGLCTRVNAEAADRLMPTTK